MKAPLLAWLGRWGCTAAALALAAAAQGCSVQAFDEQAAASSVVNSCSTQAECGPDAQCRSGMCVAALGQLTDVIVEAVPPATAFYGAGDSFLVPVDGVQIADFARDLDLPQYANVQGRVSVDFGQSSTCVASYDAADKSLGVHVQITRSEAAWGLPSATYEANSQLAAGGWEFETRVPSGSYDVYVSPLSDCVSEFPPVLVRGLSFQGPGDVPYALNVAKPSELQGTVKIDDPALLAGWSVSLLDPSQGQVISTVHTWAAGQATDFTLKYHRVDGGEAPLVRVEPPDGIVAPSILWDLSVLDLDGNGQIGLDLTSLRSLSPVRVKAQVVDGDASPGKIVGVKGASVRLRSLTLNYLSGLSARFDTTVTADEQGQVKVDLLPGRYQVVVFPPDESNLAMTTDEWVVADEPAEQAGRTVEVTTKAVMDGTVLDPLSGNPLVNTSVTATPSAATRTSYLERSLTPPPATPRPGSGFTDGTGSFALTVDSGSFDLAVQPRADSALPWLVRSRLKIPNGGLGTMTVSFPVPVSGVLRDPKGNPVQQALLRVYAPLGPSGATVPAPSLDAPGVQGVLQVAEARTDENGQFRILLPATTH